MDIKTLLADLTEGNFSKVKSFILTTNNEGTLNTSAALNILIVLCRNARLTENNNSTLIDDLYDLTVLCCNNLSDLNEDKTEKFLMSIYHLIKLFSTQKSYDRIHTLSRYVEDYCILKNFKSNMYNYYAVLFHNDILHISKNAESDRLHNFVLFTLKLLKLMYKNDLQIFFDNVRSYSLLFKNPEITNGQRTNYCIALLNLLEDVESPKNRPHSNIIIYKALLIVVNLITNNENFNCTCFENIFNVMRKVCVEKEYTDCINLLEKILKIILKDFQTFVKQDIAIFTDWTKQLKMLVKKYGVCSAVINTCSYIAKTLKTVLDSFQTFKDNWHEIFNEKLQIKLINIFEILSRIISKKSLDTENCCKKCEIKYDFYQAATVASNASVFVETMTRLNIPCTDEMHQSTLKCFTDCCQYIAAMKQAGCEKHVQSWRVVGTLIYNIAVVLYKNKDYKHAKLYSELFCTNMLIVEGTDSNGKCFENSVGASLHLYGTCCYFLKLTKEAMVILTLTMLLSTAYRKKALYTWVLLKAELTDDENDLKSTTVNHILQQELVLIKQIFPSYCYSKVEAEELVMCELQYYLKNWSSKVPVISACNDICSLSDNIVNKTRALVFSWEKVIHMLDSTYLNNLETCIEQLKISNNPNDKVRLSSLYFILYQYKSKEIINKNIEEMNDAYIPLKSAPLQPYEEPANPNDKCDIVPTYYNIKIENAIELCGILDKCLELWDVILKNTPEETVLSLVTDLNIGKMIELTAYEYRLQNFYYQMLKSWILYMKYGNLFDDKIAVVTSIGFLLEYSDCNAENSLDLEKKAENLLKSFDVTETIQLDTLVTYYINKSAGYLKSGLTEKGYVALCTAKEHLTTSEQQNLKIAEARILFLKTCYLMLPCEKKVINHEENFLLIAQDSFTIIAEFYKNSSNKCPYLISVLLEISLANGWMYKWLRLPREARCYTKESILLAQQYALPVKTAQFLSLLSFIDLLDLQFLDCEVKLNGLTKILSYESNFKTERVYKRMTKVESKVEEKKVALKQDADCFSHMFQSVLDVPVRQRRANNVLGSPELRRKPFVLPEFANHSDSCDCSKCMNFEYQRLVLDTIHLESIMNLYQGNVTQAEEYFDGGFMLYASVQKRSNSFALVPIKINDHDCVDFHLYKNFSFSYCIFLLDFSYYLIKKSDLEEASNLVDTIFKQISAEKCVNSYFWNELMVQKLNLLEFKLLAENLNNLDSNAVNKESELQVQVHTLISKTPDNKISKTRITLSISPCSEPKPKKPVKKIMFDLSDSEDEDVNARPKTPETNKNAYFKFQTPGKTPAPSVPKIKIYTPKTVNSKKSKLLTSSVSDIPALNKNTITSKSESKSNALLERRTKLLTEKLKAEQKKTVLKDCNSTECLKDLDKDGKNQKRIVCKNLMDDLNEVTKSTSELTINPSKENCPENKISSSSSSKKQSRKPNPIQTVPHSASSRTATKTVELKPLTLSVSEMSLNSKNPKTSTKNSIIKQSNTEKIETNVKTGVKKYNRIKTLPNSSSDSSPEDVAVRRSNRTKKT